MKTGTIFKLTRIEHSAMLILAVLAAEFIVAGVVLLCRFTAKTFPNAETNLSVLPAKLNRAVLMSGGNKRVLVSAWRSSPSTVLTLGCL